METNSPHTAPHAPEVTNFGPINHGGGRANKNSSSAYRHSQCLGAGLPFFCRPFVSKQPLPIHRPLLLWSRVCQRQIRVFVKWALPRLTRQEDSCRKDMFPTPMITHPRYSISACRTQAWMNDGNTSASNCAIGHDTFTPQESRLPRITPQRTTQNWRRRQNKQTRKPFMFSLSLSPFFSPRTTQ